MRRIAAVATAALTAALFALVVATPASARLDRIGPQFEERRSIWTEPSVPTDGTPERERDPQRYALETLLNKAGGGGTRATRTGGRGRKQECYFAEELLARILDNDPSACVGLPPHRDFVFIDPRLKPGGPGTPPKYSANGGGVDDLRGEPDEIRRAIARLAAFEAKRRQPHALAGSLVLDAAIGVLSNPLAHRTTRKTVFRQLVASGDYTEPVVAEDPRGREALLITFADRSRAHEVVINGVIYDLTDSAELTRELYVDPETSDILATRTLLESTTRPELDDWLAEQGGSAVIRQTLYDMVRTVRDDAFRQRRVPCEKVGVDSDGYCIDIGKRGGIVIV